MNDTQLLTRLAEANAYGKEAPLPETIWTSELALREIERRMGMKPTESPNQPTVASDQQQQEAAPPASAPDQVLNPPGQRTSPRRRRSLLVGVAAFVAVLFVGAAWGILGLLGEDDTPVAGSSDDPAATIEDYRTAYNAGDVDGVMALFSEESVMTGNSFFESAGLTEIRAVWVEDINAAATEDAYTISNVEVTGNTVTWDQVWIGGEGDKNCIEGQSAVIEDGKILLWTWSSRDVSCP
jgi:hypothetical protein